MAALQDTDFRESVEDIESNIMVIDNPGESTDSQSEQFEIDLSGHEFNGTGFSKSTEKCVKFAVSLLKAWCTSNGESADIEKMTFAELNEVLGKFYSNVRTKTGEYYSFSSLTSFRYSLNRYFQSMAEGKRFDIIENPEFFNSNEIFSTVIKSLKLKSTDKGDKNKLFLTSDELRQIYLQVFAEDSPKTLQYKVWFEVAVYFNKGGRSKQRVLTKNSFIFGNDAFGKFVFLKKDVGSDSSLNSNKDGRKMYEKRNHPLCPVLSLAKYLSKLHPETMDLFQRPKYKISKSANVWYYHQPVGKNFLGNVMYLICTQAGISKQVSNKCLKNITPEVLDACVFSIPLNKLGIPKSVEVSAIMELKKKTSTKQASSTVSQMDRFAAGDSSSQNSDIYETHGPKITYEEAKQEIQSLFQRLTPKVLSDVMLWLKNVDFSKDITGELICEDNSHFVTSQVQYNNSILSRGFQPNTYQLPPSQLPLSLNYTLPRYPLTPIPFKTVGPYNNMPQPSSVPRSFHPPAQNFVYNYSNRGLCSSLSTPVSSILPPASLQHNPGQIGMRIPHDVNVNNYNMRGNNSIEQLSPQNIPPPVASHGTVLSPTFLSSPFNYSNSSTLLNLNSHPNPNETALDTGTKHTWSNIPANLQTNQTGDGNTWSGNNVRHGKVKKASKQKRKKRWRRYFSEEIDVHRQTLQRELPVVFPWLETNGNPYEYMYFIQGREQIQGHTLFSHANDQGYMNTSFGNANDQGQMNRSVSIANGHCNNANNQGHMNTIVSNLINQDHMRQLMNSNDPGNVNMFVSNVSHQEDGSHISVNNSFESCSAKSKGIISEIKRKTNSSETEISNQASNFGTPIQKKSKYGFEPKTPEPNFQIVSVVSMSEENDFPKDPTSIDLSMYKTEEAKIYFNYLGLNLVPKKNISQRHDLQNQNNSNSIHHQQPDFQRPQHPKNTNNFQSDQDFTRYCTADKDGFLVKVTIDNQNCLPVCSRCEFKIIRKVKKYGRNFCHRICHHLDRDIAYYEALNQNEIFNAPRPPDPMPEGDDFSAQSPKPENPCSPNSDAKGHGDDPHRPTTEAKSDATKEQRKSDQESIINVPDNLCVESESSKTTDSIQKPTTPQIKGMNANNTRAHSFQNLKPSVSTEGNTTSPLLVTSAEMSHMSARTQSDTSTQTKYSKSASNSDQTDTETLVIEKESSGSNEEEIRKDKNSPDQAITKYNTFEIGLNNNTLNKSYTTNASPTQNKLTEDTSRTKSESSKALSHKEKLINIAQIKEDLFLSDEDTNYYSPPQSAQSANCQLQEDLYLSESDNLSQDSIQQDRCSINKNPPCELAVLPMDVNCNGMKKQVPLKSISDEEPITGEPDKILISDEAPKSSILNQSMKVIVEHRSNQSPKKDQKAEDESLGTIRSKRNLEQDIPELADKQTPHVSPTEGQVTRAQAELQRDISLMPEWKKLSQVVKESKDLLSEAEGASQGCDISTKILHNEGREGKRSFVSHAFRKLKANMLIRKLQRKKEEYFKLKLIKISKERESMQLDEADVELHTEDLGLNLEIDNETRQKSAKAKVMVSLPLKYFDGKLKSNNFVSDHNECNKDNVDRHSDLGKDNPSQKRSIQAEIQVKDRLSDLNSPNCSTVRKEKAVEDLGMNKSKEESVDADEEPFYANKDTENCDEMIYHGLTAGENELYDVDPCFLNKSVESIFTPEEGSTMRNMNHLEKVQTSVKTPMEHTLIETKKRILESTGNNMDQGVETQNDLSVKQISDTERNSDQKAKRDTEEEKNILGDLAEVFAHVEKAQTDTSNEDSNAEKHPSGKNFETKCYFVNPIYKSVLSRKVLDIKNSDFVKKLKLGCREAPLSKEEMIIKINQCFNDARKQRQKSNEKIEASKADSITVAGEIKNNSLENINHEDPPNLLDLQTKEDSVNQRKSGGGIRKDNATSISEVILKERKRDKFSNLAIRLSRGQPGSKLNSSKNSITAKKHCLVESNTHHGDTVPSQNLQEKGQTSDHHSRDFNRTAATLIGTSIKAEKLSPETQKRKKRHGHISKKFNRLKLNKFKGQTLKKIFIKEEPVSPNVQSSMTPQVYKHDQTNKALKVSPISPKVKLAKNASPKLTIKSVYSLNQEKGSSEMGDSGIRGTSDTHLQTRSNDKTGPVSNSVRFSKITINGMEKRASDNQDVPTVHYQQENNVTAPRAYSRSNFACLNGGAFRPVQRTISTDSYILEDSNHFHAHSNENVNPQNYRTSSSGPTSIQPDKASQVESQITTKQFLGIIQALPLQNIENPIKGKDMENQLSPEIIRPECIHPHKFVNHPLLPINYQSTLKPDCQPLVPSFRPLHLPDSTSRVRVPADMVSMFTPRLQKIPHCNSSLTTVGGLYPALHARLAPESTRKDITPRVIKLQNEGPSSISNLQLPKGQYSIASSTKANKVEGVQIPIIPTSLPLVTLKEQSKQNIHPGKVLPSSKMPHATVLRKAKPSLSSYTIHDFENLNPWNSEAKQTPSSKPLANRTQLKSPKVLSKKAYLMKRSTNPGVLSKAAKPIAKKSPIDPNSVSSTMQLSKVQKYFQNKLSNLFKTSINVTKVTDAKGQPVTPTKLMQGQVPVYIRYERKESGQRKTSVIMGKQNRPSSTDMEFFDLESTQIAFQKFQMENQPKEQSGGSGTSETGPKKSRNVEFAITTSDATKTGHPLKDEYPQCPVKAEGITSSSRIQLTKQLLPAKTITPTLQTKSSTITSERNSTRTGPQKPNVEKTPSKKNKKKARIVENAKVNDQHNETSGYSGIDKTNIEEHTKKRIALQECIGQISKINKQNHPSNEHDSSRLLPESVLGAVLNVSRKDKDPINTKKSLNKENGMGSKHKSINSSAVSSRTPSTQYGGQILKIKQRCTQNNQLNRATYTIAQRDAIMNAISAYFHHRTSKKAKNLNLCPSINPRSPSTTVIEQSQVPRSSNQSPRRSTSEISMKPTKVVWPLGFDARKASSASDLSKVVHVKPIRRPRKQILTPMSDYKGSGNFLSSNTDSRTTEDGIPLDLSLTKTKDEEKVAVDAISSEVVSQNMHKRPSLNNVRPPQSEYFSASQRKSEEPVHTTNDSSKVARKSEDPPSSRVETAMLSSRDTVAITKPPSRDPRTVKRRVAPEDSTIVTNVFSKYNHDYQNHQQQKGKQELHGRSDSHLVSKKKNDVNLHSTCKVFEDNPKNPTLHKASTARSSCSASTRYCMGDVPLHSSKACTNLLEDKASLAHKENVFFGKGGNLNSSSLKDGAKRTNAPNHTGTLSADVEKGAIETAKFTDLQGSVSNVFKLKPCSVVINKDLIYPLEFKIKNEQDRYCNEQEEEKPGLADDGAQSMVVEEQEEDSDIFDSQTTQILGDSRPSEEVQNINKRKRPHSESFSITTKKNNKLLLRIKLGDHHKIRRRKKHCHIDKDDSDLQDTDDEEKVRDRYLESHHASNTSQSD